VSLFTKTIVGAAAAVRHASRAAMKMVFFIMFEPFVPTVPIFGRCHSSCHTNN